MNDKAIDYIIFFSIKDYIAINEFNEENDAKNNKEGLLFPSKLLNNIQLSPNRHQQLDFQENISHKFSVNEKLKEEIELATPMTFGLSFPKNVNIFDAETNEKRKNKNNSPEPLNFSGNMVPIPPVVDNVPGSSKTEFFLPEQNIFQLPCPDFNYKSLSSR